MSNLSSWKGVLQSFEQSARRTLFFPCLYNARVALIIYEMDDVPLLGCLLILSWSDGLLAQGVWPDRVENGHAVNFSSIALKRENELVVRFGSIALKRDNAPAVRFSSIALKQENEPVVRFGSIALKRENAPAMRFCLTSLKRENALNRA